MKIVYKYFKSLIILLTSMQLVACDLFDVRGSNASPGSNNQSDIEKASGASAKNGGGVEKNSVVVSNSINEAASINEPLIAANDSLLAMLRYDRYISKLQEQALVDEYKRMHDAYFIRPNDRTRLKLAMLLARPETQFSDIIQAKQLLNDIRSDTSANPAIVELAHYLLDKIIEYEQSMEKLSQLADNLKQEQIKRKKIEEQLEALKTIEESITQRQNGSVGK